MNNKQGPMMGGQNPFGNLPGAQRTPKAVKWIVIILFGILPFILLAFLIGNATDFGYSWGNKSTNIVEVSYGIMWVIGIVTIIVLTLAMSLIVFFSDDVNTDVVPLTVGFLFMGMSFYIIPLPGWFTLFFIVIAPVFFLFGLILGVLGVGIITLRKLMREAKDPEVQKQVKEMQEQMKKGQMPGQQPKPPKDKEENYQDNPFVDVEEEDK